MKGILRWILILAVVGMAFFGFAYWRGYSPSDVLVRIQNLVLGISLGGAPSEAADETPSGGGISIPGAGVAKEALKETRGARSQVWDFFETPITIGKFTHPLWVWLVLLVIAALVLIPGGWWVAKRIGNALGIDVHKPDDPVKAAIKVAAVGGIGAALTGLGAMFGWQIPVALLTGVAYEYLLYDVGWQKFFNNIKNFIPGDQIGAGSYLINLIATPFLFVALVVLTLLAPGTITALISPDMVNAATINAVVTGATGVTASVMPSQLNPVGIALKSIASICLPALSLFTAGYNGLVMLVETGLLTLVLAGATRIRRR